jgi:excisionase family DNA binding protein
MNEMDKYVTVAQAQAMLGVSKTKIARMISRGELTFVRHALDQRVKLIKRTDVERLARGFRQSLAIAS